MIQYRTPSVISCATTAPTRTPVAASARRPPPRPSPPSPDQAPEDAAIPDGPYRAALRRRWAKLIRRVYEVDPLIRPRCGSEMRVIGFITLPLSSTASWTSSADATRSLASLRSRPSLWPPPLEIGHAHRASAVASPTSRHYFQDRTRSASDGRQSLVARQ
jgi:hypothetical protein